jgi:hypothetical protein
MSDTQTCFNPSYGSNTSLTLVAATPQSRAINPQDATIRISNTGATNGAYALSFTTANGVQVASATKGVYIPPNSTLMFTKAYGADTLSLLSTAGTTVEVITGTNGF